VNIVGGNRAEVLGRISPSMSSLLNRQKWSQKLSEAKIFLWTSYTKSNLGSRGDRGAWHSYLFADSLLEICPKDNHGEKDLYEASLLVPSDGKNIDINERFGATSD